MYTDFLRALAPTLAAQHGVFALRQAAMAGFGRHRVASLARRGLLDRVDVGVYAQVGTPDTWRRRVMAAVLAAGDGAVASHRAAAHLLGVGGFTTPPVEITVPRGRSFRRADVVVHESTDLDRAEVGVVDGIPTTGPARVAVDVGTLVSPQRFRNVLRELRYHHGVTLDELLRCYVVHARRGRNGCGALRETLERYAGSVGVAESTLEQAVIDLLVDAGVRLPVAQFPVEVDGVSYRLDLAYPEVRVAIEIDGPHHRDAVVAAEDARRDARLRAAGWGVLRFTLEDVLARPGVIVATIAHALADAS